MDNHKEEEDIVKLGDSLGKIHGELSNLTKIMSGIPKAFQQAMMHGNLPQRSQEDSLMRTAKNMDQLLKAYKDNKLISSGGGDVKDNELYKKIAKALEDMGDQGNRTINTLDKFISGQKINDKEKNIILDLIENLKRDMENTTDSLFISQKTLTENFLDRLEKVSGDKDAYLSVLKDMRETSASLPTDIRKLIEQGDLRSKAEVKNQFALTREMRNVAQKLPDSDERFETTEELKKSLAGLRVDSKSIGDTIHNINNGKGKQGLAESLQKAKEDLLIRAGNVPFGYLKETAQQMPGAPFTTSAIDILHQGYNGGVGEGERLLRSWVTKQVLSKLSIPEEIKDLIQVSQGTFGENLFWKNIGKAKGVVNTIKGGSWISKGAEFLNSGGITHAKQSIEANKIFEANKAKGIFNGAEADWKLAGENLKWVNQLKNSKYVAKGIEYGKGVLNTAKNSEWVTKGIELGGKVTPYLEILGKTAGMFDGVGEAIMVGETLLKVKDEFKKHPVSSKDGILKQSNTIGANIGVSIAKELGSFSYLFGGKKTENKVDKYIDKGRVVWDRAFNKELKSRTENDKKFGKSVEDFTKSMDLFKTWANFLQWGANLGKKTPEQEKEDRRRENNQKKMAAKRRHRVKNELFRQEKHIQDAGNAVGGWIGNVVGSFNDKGKKKVFGNHKQVKLDEEQIKNAKIIRDTGKKLGMSDRDIQIAEATAMTESGLRNINHGDRDSLGLFQQRSSWGSAKDRTNPAYAATAFYHALGSVKERNNLSVAKAAQKVQQSKFKDGSNYAPYEEMGAGLVSYFNKNNKPKNNVIASAHTPPVELAHAPKGKPKLPEPKHTETKNNMVASASPTNTLLRKKDRIDNDSAVLHNQGLQDSMKV